MATMGDIFHEAEQAVFGRHHHHQTPAQQPATMAPAGAAKGSSMSLATLEDDVKADLTDGMNWLEGMVARVKAAAPGIIATSEAVGSSTVGKLAEVFLGKVLPPDIEQEFLTIASRYALTWGQPAPAQQAPAAPAAQ